MTATDLISGFRCPICNGNQVELADVHKDETPVSCANCNAALGTWGEVRQAEGPLLSKKAEQDVKEVLQAAVPDWQTK
jgi:hypothetical protein